MMSKLPLEDNDDMKYVNLEDEQGIWNTTVVNYRTLEETGTATSSAKEWQRLAIEMRKYLLGQLAVCRRKKERNVFVCYFTTNFESNSGRKLGVKC